MFSLGSGELGGEAVGLQSRAPSREVAEGRGGPGGEVKMPPFLLPPSLWMAVGRPHTSPALPTFCCGGVPATTGAACKKMP